jgi:hypothetical protein
MDPYLESIWHDFHERTIPAIAAHLTRQLLPRYIVLIDENVYVHDQPPEEGRLLGRADLSVVPEGQGRHAAAAGVLEAPAHVLLPAPDVESLSYLKVLDRESRELITVIELLSPTNKRPGDHRAQYLSKRSSVLSSTAHLVEIDLLRGGRPLPAADRPECTYSVLVSRAGHRPRADFWPFGIRDPLPIVPIPLRPTEEDARVDLRAILDRVYEEAGYEIFLSRCPLDPPLTGEDVAWARALLPHAATEAQP